MINREQELRFLKERAASKRAELVVMWGRRRLGKTTLLKALCEAHPAIYFLATRAPAHEQLQRLSIAFAEFFKDPLLERAALPSWEDAFGYLARNAKSRIVLAVDEFPYLVKADPSIPSRFQFGWDEHLAKNPNVMLLLNGSSFGYDGTARSRIQVASLRPPHGPVAGRAPQLASIPGVLPGSLVDRYH